MKGHHLITHNRKSSKGVGSVGLEWSPDGTQLISRLTLATVQVVDRATGQVSTIYRGHDERAHTVVWSPDGTKVASGSSDNTVQVWHARTGHPLTTYTHKDLVDAIAWSPDSKQIASLCWNDCEVKVWHAETGRHLATYTSGSVGIGSRVAWSPDGRYIATSCAPYGCEGIVEVWEGTTKQLVTTYTMSDRSGDAVSSFSWSPDSTQIASSYGYFVVWSPDGKSIASNKKIEIHDAMTGGFLAEYEPADHYSTSVHVWETRTGSSRIICQGTASVESAAWSPDGNYLVAGHSDHIVRVWDIATNRVIAVHRGYMCYGPVPGGVNWSPDGNYLAYTAFLDEIQTYPEVS